MDTLCHIMNYRKNTTLKPITLLHYKYTQVFLNNWIQTLKEKIYSTPLANIQNITYINKSKLNVENRLALN